MTITPRSVHAAAKYLKAHEAELQGTVKLLFQPAEEGGAGAKVMVDEGAMQGVSAVFGLHVWPTAPSGTIQTRVSYCSSCFLLCTCLVSLIWLVLHVWIVCSHPDVKCYTCEIDNFAHALN